VKELQAKAQQKGPMSGGGIKKSGKKWWLDGWNEVKKWMLLMLITNLPRRNVLWICKHCINYFSHPFLFINYV
jgi:hypothetical protein